MTRPGGFALAAAAVVMMAGAAWADTTDQTWQNRITVAKTGDHCADARVRGQSTVGTDHLRGERRYCDCARVDPVFG